MRTSGVPEALPYFASEDEANFWLTAPAAEHDNTSVKARQAGLNSERDLAQLLLQEALAAVISSVLGQGCSWQHQSRRPVCRSAAR